MLFPPDEPGENRGDRICEKSVCETDTESRFYEEKV